MKEGLLAKTIGRRVQELKELEREVGQMYLEKQEQS